MIIKKLSLRYKLLVYLSTLIPKIHNLSNVNKGSWVDYEIVWLARIYMISNTSRIRIVEPCWKEERR